AELAVDALRVALHGVRREEELARDLLRREHRLEVAEHGALARAERLEQRLGPVAVRARRGPLEPDAQVLDEAAMGRAALALAGERLAEGRPGLQEPPRRAVTAGEAERPLERGRRAGVVEQPVPHHGVEDERLDVRREVDVVALTVEPGRERLERRG